MEYWKYNVCHAYEYVLILILYDEYIEQVQDINRYIDTNLLCEID